MYFPATCYQTLGSAFTGVNFLCWPHLSDLIHFSNQVLMLHHISSVPAQVFFPLCLPDTPAFSSCTFSCRDRSGFCGRKPEVETSIVGWRSSPRAVFPVALRAFSPINISGQSREGMLRRSPPSPLHPWGLEGDLEMGGFVTPSGRAALLSMSLLAVLPTAISADHI